MIKIIEKEVKIVKEYDVEPKVVTLYYANAYNKNVIKYKNCVFKTASPVGWGANDANEYWLKYENNKYYLYVKVDITTGKVKDYSEYFFDYEQAVSIYKKLRIKLMQTLKDRIEDRIKLLEEDRKELEKLENFEKKRR
jgi:hypothetical protein